MGMEEVKSTAKAFMRGARHEFMSLEDALTHPKAERFLIDLQAPGVDYDAVKQRVTFTRTDPTKKQTHTHTIDINPQFHQYMQDYGSETRFITDAGTPWLTRDQELDYNGSQEQKDAYYQALSAGPNQDVVMLSWRKTVAKKKDSGHTALSIGTLNLADGSSDQDAVPIYEYEPEISGSFYPSTGPLFRPGKLALKPIAEHIPALEKRLHHSSLNTDQHLQAARDRHGENPMAYSIGVTARDSVEPVGAAVGAMVGITVTKKMVDLIRGKQSGAMDDKAVEVALKGLALLTAGYLAAKATGALDMATGVVLLKEEERGSGILASLVTPAQLDIMQHTLYGMYKTYFDKYNILSSNCADFADKMMEDIGLQTSKLLQETIAVEDAKNVGPVQKVLNTISIPESIRPSRISYAYRNRKPVTGEVEIDGQKLAVSLVSVSGQSSVLIETDNQLFNEPPIQTFQKVLKEGITMKQGQDGRFHFQFQPHVEQIEVSQAAARSR